MYESGVLSAYGQRYIPVGDSRVLLADGDGPGSEDAIAPIPDSASGGPLGGVDVHEAQTDVNPARASEDQEQITPGERVAISVRGSHNDPAEITGTVRANGRVVGRLSPSPTELSGDNPVDTANAYFTRRSEGAVEITVGGEPVHKLPSVVDSEPDAPGRQNTADPEPAQTVDRTIDERARVVDESDAGNTGPGVTDASDGSGMSAGLLAALAAAAVALFMLTNG